MTQQTLVSHDQLDAQNAHALEIAQSHLEDALTIARQTFQDATESDYPKGIADSLLVQAQVNYYHADYEKVFMQIGKALAIYDNLQDHVKRSHALHIMGITFRQIGDFSSAIDAFTKSLGAARSVESDEAEIRALNGLASIYGNSHQPAIALNYLKQALEIAETGDYPRQRAAILGNICYSYNTMNNPQAALMYGLQSWELYQKMPAPSVAIINSCVRISQTYHELGDNQKALQFANHGLALAYKFGAKSDLVEVLHQIGVIYADMGDETTALTYAQEAITFAESAGVELSAHETYFFASRLYKNRGDYQHALEALEQYHKHRMALYNEESEAKMQQLEARYKVEAARKEVAFYHLRSQELEQLREQDRYYFNRLNEMKDKFIREASHDLKNPLAIILLNVQLAERYLQRDPARVADYLAQIKQQTLRSKELVTELLDLAWLETGRALDNSSIPIVPFIRNLVEDIRSLAHEKSLTLTLINQVADETTINADAKQMARVVDNLLSNAIKYTPNGGAITVEIRIEAGETEPEVAVMIRDTGIGLTEEQKLLVFEPFYRANDDLDSDSTGLGLTIVHTIITQHGGKMLLESELGKGSMFGFRLPIL